MDVGQTISINDPMTKQGKIFVELIRKREGAQGRWFLVRFPWGEAWRSEEALELAQQPLIADRKPKK